MQTTNLLSDVRRRLLAAFAATFLSLALLANASAQTPAPAAPAPPAPKGTPPIQLKLNESGDLYLRMVLWTQFWLRATELNPGTQLPGTDKDVIGDVALRRARLLFFGKITPRVLILLHVGINNQSFAEARKPQVFVHDAWGQFDVYENYLSLGAGLHYWNGISRMTNSSTFRFLALDAPTLNWPFIEKTDQFGRQLGVFAKGQIGSFDYRLAVNKPFQLLPDLTAGGPVDFHSGPDAKSFSGYLQWMFLDVEPNMLPFTAGTYLGAKKVLNLGVGAHYQPNAMARRRANGNLDKHDLVLLGADAYLDHPLGGAGALTAYGVYYYYDFGPDYVRNVGIMNLGSGGTTFNGPGNAFPLIGTGHHVYTQFGYLLPFSLRDTQLQPFVTLLMSFMEGLDDPAITPEVGFNWLIASHNAKLTMQYRSRPVFERQGTRVELSERASEFVTQMQLLF